MKFVSGSKHPDALGLTIYFPNNGYRLQYEQSLQFSNERWDEFIELFITPIQIEHTPINDSESKTGKFEITAVIKGSKLDEGNIYLFCKEEGVPDRLWVQMMPKGMEHEYSAEIQIEEYETNVYYFIRTQENTQTENKVYSPQDVDEQYVESWYSFYVGNDTIPPIINHNPSEDVLGSVGDPFTFYLDIMDNLGLDPGSLFLHYNLNNSGWYSDQSLDFDIKMDRYYCTIPSPPMRSIIYYYFTASDLAMIPNHIRAPNEINFEFDISGIKPKAAFEVSTIQAYTYKNITFTSTSKPEEFIKDYQWDFGDGTILEGKKEVTHFYQIPNKYIVTLKVTDQNGLWNMADMTVEILNTPPVAHLKTEPILVNGEPYTVDSNNFIVGPKPIYEDDIIELDCTGSYDIDGFIKSWTWKFGDGNQYTEYHSDWNNDSLFDSSYDRAREQTEMTNRELEAQLNITTEGKLTYKYPFEGEYIIEFSILDNNDEEAVAPQLLVIVKNYMPTPNPGYSEIIGLNVFFTPVRGIDDTLDTESDRNSLNYTWDFGDGEISHTASPNHTYPKQKKYDVSLTVRDDDGDEVTKSFVIDLKDESDEDSINILAYVVAAVISILLIIIVIFLMIVYKIKQKPSVVIEKAEQELSGGVGNRDGVMRVPVTSVATKSTVSPVSPVSPASISHSTYSHSGSGPGAARNNMFSSTIPPQKKRSVQTVPSKATQDRYRSSTRSPSSPGGNDIVTNKIKVSDLMSMIKDSKPHRPQ